LGSENRIELLQELRIIKVRAGKFILISLDNESLDNERGSARGHTGWRQRVGVDITSGPRCNGSAMRGHIGRRRRVGVDRTSGLRCKVGGGIGIKRKCFFVIRVRIDIGVRIDIRVRTDYIDNLAMGSCVRSSGIDVRLWNINGSSDRNTRVGWDGPNGEGELRNTARSSCRGGLGNWGTCTQKLTRSECRARGALREECRDT
jgi:hypothetical protein